MKPDLDLPRLSAREPMYRSDPDGERDLLASNIRNLIDKHLEGQRAPATSTAQQEQKPWLTVVEAAQYLGYSCSNDRAPNSVYELARKIGHRFNSHWLIHRDDLDAAIRGGQ